MKKSEIIHIIKNKNQKELSFVDNYQVLKEKLAFKGGAKKVRESILTIYYDKFKYAIFALSLSVMIIAVVLLQTSENKPTESLTENNIVHNYFEINKLDYIKTPIQTIVIGDALINIYFGINQEGNVYFVYEKESAIITDVEIAASKFGFAPDTEPHIVNSFLSHNSSFSVTKDTISTFYIITFKYKDKNNQPQVEEVLINIGPLLAYLNR